MNDRIAKWLKNHLVNCEYTEFGWQECHRYEFDEDELKEYTKLIVWECISKAERYGLGCDAVEQLKEDFGVEE